MSRIRFAPLLVVILIAGCKDAVEPVPNPVGSLSFTYSGAVDGTFDAQGEYPAPGAQPTSFAAAEPSPLGGGVAIIGLRTRDLVQDALILDVGTVTQPGTYSPRLSLFFYGVAAGNISPARLFMQEAGEVVVTSVSDERIEGTFTAILVAGDLLFPMPPDTVPPDTVVVTDGEFDVPIIDETSLGPAMTRMRSDTPFVFRCALAAWIASAPAGCW
ncbi:MAG: hypothetical protein ACREKN_01165 [Longimicrobiaceae bacterium]